MTWLWFLLPVAIIVAAWLIQRNDTRSINGLWFKRKITTERRRP